MRKYDMPGIEPSQPALMARPRPTAPLRPGLHNSESSKGQIDQHKLAASRKSLFRHSVEEILKGRVIIRNRAFATFSATEFSRAARKDLAGRMWPAGRMLCRPDLDGVLIVILSNLRLLWLNRQNRFHGLCLTVISIIVISRHMAFVLVGLAERTQAGQVCLCRPMYEACH